jgi:hypothetical protein
MQGGKGSDAPFAAAGPFLFDAALAQNKACPSLDIPFS